MKRIHLTETSVSDRRGMASRVTALAFAIPLFAGCGAPVYRSGGGDPPPSAVRSAPSGDAVLEDALRPLSPAVLGSGPIVSIEEALAAGQPGEALRQLDALRADSARAASGVPENEYHRLRGTAYYALGKWGLARRYLAKGLSATHGAERQRQLARLIYCSRELAAERDVARFSRMLGADSSRPDVKEILSGKDSLLAAAATAVVPAAPARTATPPQRSEARSAPRHDAHPRPLAGLGVLPRSAWSARPANSNLDVMRDVDKITVHHTGDEAIWIQPQTEVASTINAIQRYHQEQKHWADIGYHFLIDRSGTIWQGRLAGYQGAHAGGANNRGNLGIVLLGNYFKQSPSRAQIVSLTRLVSALTDAYPIPPENVFTHGELAGGSTSCPGPSLTRIVLSLRAALRRHTLALGD